MKNTAIETWARATQKNALDKAFERGKAEAQEPLLVDWERESRDPLVQIDEIYAAYATTFGKAAPDDDMARTVRRVRHMVYDWWTWHRSQIRAALVLYKSEPRIPPQTFSELAHLEREAFGDPGKETGIYNPKVVRQYAMPRDAIARSKGVLAAVDALIEHPTDGNRTTLRKLLMNEFEELLEPRPRPYPGKRQANETLLSFWERQWANARSGELAAYREIDALKIRLETATPKDHLIAQAVNNLRDAAIKYHYSSQLRGRLSEIVLDLVKAHVVTNTDATTPLVDQKPSLVNDEVPFGMNIYANPGTKVKFHDANGYPMDRETAREAGFVKGGIYTVDSVNIGRSSTSVIFREIPGSWNSVMFGDV